MSVVVHSSDVRRTIAEYDNFRENRISNKQLWYYVLYHIVLRFPPNIHIINYNQPLEGFLIAGVVTVCPLRVHIYLDAGTS